MFCVKIETNDLPFYIRSAKKISGDHGMVVKASTARRIKDRVCVEGNWYYLFCAWS